MKSALMIRPVLLLFLFLSLASISYSFGVAYPERISVDYLEIRQDSIFYIESPYTGTIYDEDNLGNVIYERQVVNGVYQLQVVPRSAFSDRYRTILHDETLTFQGSPFTGIVRELHENGSVFTEHRWINGKKDGAWLAWYPSGILSRSTSFKDGNIHGLQTRWFKNGKQKEMHCMYENKLTGISRIWNEEGELTEMVIHDHKNTLDINLGEVSFDEANVDRSMKNENRFTPVTVFMLVKGTSLESRTEIYHFGRFNINESYYGVVIAAPHLYGWMQYFYRVYDSNASEFLGDWIMLAGGEGDAGEELKMNTWILDIDQDGEPELISRIGTTVLEIDAPESERETVIDPIEIFTFSEERSAFEEMEVEFDMEMLLDRMCQLTF